jgi:PKD repeat protein
VKGRSLSRTLLFIILLLSTMPIITVNQVTAEDFRVSVDPSESEASPGQYFTIDINITNAPEDPGVAMWEFKLRFDPGVIYTNDSIDVMVFEGDFLKGVAPPGWEVTYFWAELFTNYLVVGCWFLYPDVTVGGSGVLATIKFLVTDKGRAPLDLYDLKLSSQPGTWNWPEDQYPTVEDGVFYTPEPKADFIYYTEAYPPSQPGMQPSFKPVVNETITFNATFIELSEGKYTGSYDPDTMTPSDPDGALVSYLWDFGDDTPPVTEYDPVITHSYDEVGSYRVNLTVTDNEGNQDFKFIDVSVVIHDIAIIEVTVNATRVQPGDIVSINVTVENQASEIMPQEEYFNITCYYDDTVIWYNKTENKKSFSLPLERDPERPDETHPPLATGDNMTVTFIWNTTGVAPGSYTIRANVTIVHSYTLELLPGETDTADNVFPRADLPPINIIVSAHDIAITNVHVSPKAVFIGGTISINVTVENQGKQSEVFDVSVYANSTIIASSQDQQLAYGEQKTLPFSWNTTGFAEGIYLIKANITVLPGEIDISDNEFLCDEIIKLTTTPIYDIAIVNIQVEPKQVYIGRSISINVTVENKGTQSEVFDVSVYANSTIIASSQDQQLAYGEQKTLPFSWNTTGFAEGIYLIKANITVLPGEIDISDNEFPRAGIPPVVVEVTVNIITPPPIVIGGVSFHVVIESNSEVSDFAFNQADKEISFKISGELYRGFCNVTIPKVLLEGDPWKVWVDDTLVTPDLVENATHTFLYFEFTLSTRLVKIIGTKVATPPVVIFTVSPKALILGEEAEFDAAESYDPDGEIVSFSWDFDGDGVYDYTSDKPYAKFKYTEADIYTVTLTVTDNNQLKNATTATLAVLPHRDLAVTDITSTAVEATIGQTISFNVTIENQGTETENINVTVYYDSFVLETKTDIPLSAGASVTIMFEWDTLEVSEGTYTISAEADVIPGETDTDDNIKIFGAVTLKKSNSSIFITLSRTSILVGENLTISGSVTPTRPGVNVTIHYKLDEETAWNTLTIVQTDENSQYSFTWTPSEPGTYNIKAGWDGDYRTVKAESDVKTVVVQTSGLKVPLHFLGGIVIAVAAAIVLIHLFKARKQ